MHYPYVITISSEKGGVGKTTLATNLAIYLKALVEDLPVSICSFDNHFTVDRMLAIPGQKPQQSVHDLLAAGSGADLLVTGQYGVNYIPSSETLADLKGAIRSSMLLAGILSRSEIPGILIIDTRPELDILTQNALFAADRVLIPVKDLPSLENCRNIFALFDKRGMDRRGLTLLPCLIDERIKYDGPFRDQKSLLRAFAINRGYRCMNHYISKSPKVESLNTNPDGRIYPILTHARGTEVFQQLGQLATELLEEYRQTIEPRAKLFHQWQLAEDGRQKDAFFARLSGLRPTCPLCGQPVLGDPARLRSHYLEVSDGRCAGFLHAECGAALLLETIYAQPKNLPEDSPAREAIAEAGRNSLFVFRPASGETERSATCHRFTLQGELLGSRVFPLKEFEGGLFSRERTPLWRLLQETVGSPGGSEAAPWLILHPVLATDAERILSADGYQGFGRIKQRVLERLVSPS